MTPDFRFYVQPGRTLATTDGVPALTIGRALEPRSGSCPVSPSEADSLTYVFAAAPAMLDALRELVAEFDVDGPRNDTGGIVLARQAIALAENR